jgi:hypothetical protein
MSIHSCRRLQRPVVLLTTYVRPPRLAAAVSECVRLKTLTTPSGVQTGGGGNLPSDKVCFSLSVATRLTLCWQTYSSMAFTTGSKKNLTHQCRLSAIRLSSRQRIQYRLESDALWSMVDSMDSSPTHIPSTAQHPSHTTQTWYLLVQSHYHSYVDPLILCMDHSKPSPPWPRPTNPAPCPPTSSSV